MLDELIGEGYEYDLNEIEKLMEYVDDPAIQNQFLEIKRQRKEILAKLVKDRCGVEIDPNSIL